MNLKEINNVLIVAPHADDETLGCGGTIKKLAKLGKKVFILILTNANLGDSRLFSKEAIEQVRAEALKAHKYLDVEQTIFAEFPAPKLDVYPIYKIANYIGERIEEFEIDTLFVPHRGDIHLDHKRVFEASIVASRPQGNYRIKRIYAYETLSETEWAAPYPEDNFIPNIFNDITNEIETKISAFECFDSQIKIFPHPRSIKGIKTLAAVRGSVVSVNSAEAFALIREII